MVNCLRALLVALVLVVTGSWADERFPGIEALMSDRDFQATGLHKLSKDERKALDAWLLRYTAGEAQELADTNEAVQEVEQTITVDSVLQTPFNGWRGDTVFKLENGQIWRQRRDGRYTHDGEDLRVRISKNFMGNYKMTLLANGKSVQVSRVK